MKNNLCILHRLTDTISVTHIASDYLNIAANRRLVQPSPRPKGIVMHKGPNIGTCPNQLFRQMASNEATGTSY
jgi:hypothetical protein